MAWNDRGRIHARLAGKTIVEASVVGESLLLRASDGDAVAVRWDDQFGPLLDERFLVGRIDARDASEIDRWVRGRTIGLALTDGNLLILYYRGGEQVKIGWDVVTGRPKFVGQDVSIKIVFPSMFGTN